MEVFGRPDKELKRFSAARGPYAVWERVVTSSRWTRFEDVRLTRPDADRVGTCYVFNLGGNKFRLIAKIRFAAGGREGVVDVRALLTHAEYDKHGWKGDC
jgi:mRNA interferase HigB